MSLRIATEAAGLLLERWKVDGLRNFLDGNPGPFIHQTNFWDSEKSEGWLFGANRSGKTQALAALVSSYLRFGKLNPYQLDDEPTGPTKVWAVSLKFDMGRNIFQPKLFNNGAGITSSSPLIPDSEIADWNITNQTLRLKNGSICIFKSGDQGSRAFQGADVDLIAFDEVPDEEVYKECTLRVGGGKRLMIRGAATILPPPGEPGGVTWMYPSKVKPWLDAGKKNPTLDIFTASIYDNTTILPEELERLEALFPPGTAEHMIRLRGALLPTIGGSLVYSSFMAAFHMNPAISPRDRDGIPRPNVHPYLPLVLAVDFNAMNGVWLVGQKVNRMFRVLDEIALERSDVAAMTYEFRSRFPAHSGELWIYGDATGRRRDGQTGESSFFLIQSYLQGYPAPLRFVLPQVNPPVRDRVDAVNLALKPGDGGKSIDIAAHCSHLAHDLEVAKWKANGSVDKSNPAEQLNGADALGYWICGDSPVPRYARSTAGLKSIRGPRYNPTSGSGSGKVFPSGITSIGRGMRAAQHV